MRFLNRRENNNKHRSRNPNQTLPKQSLYSYTQARRSSEQMFDRSSQPEAPKQKSWFKKNRPAKLTNLFAILFFLSILVYLGSISSSPKIKYNQQNPGLRDQSVYQDAINSEFSSSWLNKNKTTINADKISENIKSKFPEIESLNIQTSFLNRHPTVEVTFAEPIARLVTANSIYILDKEGRALFDQKQTSSKVNLNNLLTINDSSGLEITIGKPALTEQQMGFLEELVGQLDAKKIKPRSFVLSHGGAAIDVKFEDIKYIVKFSFFADPKQSSGAFFAIREQIENENKVPKEYIDLRIPERAYIK